MYTLRYLEQAKKDLIQIKRYISSESGMTNVGIRYTEKLREQCKKLAQISGTIGQDRSDLFDGVRSFPYGNYVIFFRYSVKYLEIVTIIEGHRNIEALFQAYDSYMCQ